MMQFRLVLGQGNEKKEEKEMGSGLYVNEKESYIYYL